MAKTQTITIPAMKIETIEISLIGDSPLITHKWSEKAKKQMLDNQMKIPKVAREAKDPWQDFCDSMYWLDGQPEKATQKDIDDGRFGFPLIGFKAAAVTACTSHDMTKVAARQSFHVLGDMAQIDGDAPVMREDMVRIGMGTADLRYRGEFRQWRTTFKVAFNAGVMSAEQVINAFNVAGFGVGVGEWRPEKDGQNGRFHVAVEGE